MKVIFLDIDGVLRHAGYCDPDGDPNDPLQLWRVLDPAAVARLDRLAASTGSVVVISSSWRESMPCMKLTRLLRIRGFAGKVIGQTPCCGRRPGTMRGSEIDKWLSEAVVPVDGFVILDDMEACYLAPHQDRCVTTDWTTGLLDCHIQIATEILRKPFARSV